MQNYVHYFQISTLLKNGVVEFKQIMQHAFLKDEMLCLIYRKLLTEQNK